MGTERASVPISRTPFPPFRTKRPSCIIAIAGAGVMLFDPIFQGQAISLMAGRGGFTPVVADDRPILFYLTESWPLKRSKV